MTGTTTTTGSLWTRFLDTVLPAPNPDRLVRVTEVGRTTLPLAEASLADVDISPVISESRSTHGDSRFIVLVAARDLPVAEEVLAGM